MYVCKCMKATVIWGGVFERKSIKTLANVLKHGANLCKCMKPNVIWGGVFDAKINKQQNLLKNEANVCKCMKATAASLMRKSKKNKQICRKTKQMCVNV